MCGRAFASHPDPSIYRFHHAPLSEYLSLSFSLSFVSCCFATLFCMPTLKIAMLKQCWSTASYYFIKCFMLLLPFRQPSLCVFVCIKYSYREVDCQWIFSTVLIHKRHFTKALTMAIALWTTDIFFYFHFYFLFFCTLRTQNTNQKKKKNTNSTPTECRWLQSEIKVV